MKKLLSYILSPFFWIYFVLILVIFQPIQWICFNFFGYNVHKKSVDILNWFLLSAYRVMGTQLVFENPYALPQNTPIIFVSNHQSMFDIPGLIWYLHSYNPKFVSKIELSRGIPSISYNLKKSGAALIDRSKADQALTEIARLGKFAEAHNYSVAIFPEGTRSKTGKLRPFAVKGFIKFLECMPHALVVPVSIHNSWKFAQYGGFVISFGENIIWRVLEPLQLGDNSPGQILEMAESAIRKDLGQ